MVELLHSLKDSNLWGVWYTPYYEGIFLIMGVYSLYGIFLIMGYIPYYGIFLIMADSYSLLWGHAGLTHRPLSSSFLGLPFMGTT